jgi:hypothetical protein
VTAETRGELFLDRRGERGGGGLYESQAREVVAVDRGVGEESLADRGHDNGAGDLVGLDGVDQILSGGASLLVRGSWRRFCCLDDEQRAATASGSAACDSQQSRGGGPRR